MSSPNQSLRKPWASSGWYKTPLASAELAVDATTQQIPPLWHHRHVTSQRNERGRGSAPFRLECRRPNRPVSLSSRHTGKNSEARALGAALSAITGAVVGVIFNLAIWGAK